MPHGQLYNSESKFTLTTSLPLVTKDNHQPFEVIDILLSSVLLRYQYPTISRLVVIQTSMSSTPRFPRCHPDLVVIQTSSSSTFQRFHRRAARTTLGNIEAIQLGKAMFIHSKITVVTIPSPESIVMLPNKHKDS